MAELTKDARGFVSGIVRYLAGDKQIASQVPKLRKLLSKVTATDGKDVVAYVITAVDLQGEEKQKLTEALEKLVKHPVKLVCSVDEKLIAGMQIKIGDWIVDTTFMYQLQSLAHVLGE
ncbi:MAG: ATP synthase F1 subunit delta [Candidatus Gottesmanbacteria bacterium]